MLGTDGYIAPEAYLGDYSPKSDIFACGVVMYLLIAKRYPYADDIFDDGPNENYVGSPKMKEIYGKMEKFQVKFKTTTWQPFPQAREFCKLLLSFDVNERPDTEEALQHPWILAGGEEQNGGTLLRDFVPGA